MGHKSKANHALPMAALVQAINFIKEEAAAKPTSAEVNYLWKDLYEAMKVSLWMCQV